jgi:large subunit ribosomal protein L19
VQVFEGVCIHRRHRGQRGSFTIRKVTDGVGVERVWPESSPRIHQIELISRGRVRSAKLYYLRDRSGNAAKIRQRIGNYSSNTAPVDTAEADGSKPPSA